MNENVTLTVWQPACEKVTVGANALKVATVPPSAVHRGRPTTVAPAPLPTKLTGTPTEAEAGPLIEARGPLAVGVAGGVVAVAVGGTAVAVGVGSGVGVEVAGRAVAVAGPVVATGEGAAVTVPAVAPRPGVGVLESVLPVIAPVPGPADRVPATWLSGVGVLVAESAADAAVGVESPSPREKKNAPASSASPPTTSEPPIAVSLLDPRAALSAANGTGGAAAAT